jgi:hypothetical protein
MLTCKFGINLGDLVWGGKSQLGRCREDGDHGEELHIALARSQFESLRYANRNKDWDFELLKIPSPFVSQ